MRTSLFSTEAPAVLAARSWFLSVLYRGLKHYQYHYIGLYKGHIGRTKENGNCLYYNRFRGLKNYQYHVEVHLMYPIYTIIVQGIWNHNIDNYSGPYIMLVQVILRTPSIPSPQNCTWTPNPNIKEQAVVLHTLELRVGTSTSSRS